MVVGLAEEVLGERAKNPARAYWVLRLGERYDVISIYAIDEGRALLEERNQK